jgi:hypothetical protein
MLAATSECECSEEPQEAWGARSISTKRQVFNINRSYALEYDLPS